MQFHHVELVLCQSENSKSKLVKLLYSLAANFIFSFSLETSWTLLGHPSKAPFGLSLQIQQHEQKSNDNCMYSQLGIMILKLTSNAPN